MKTPANAIERNSYPDAVDPVTVAELTLQLHINRVGRVSRPVFHGA
jgi:hypothetical protein